MIKERTSWSFAAWYLITDKVSLEHLPEVVFEALFFILLSGEKLFLFELADLIYELAENPI